ncbi:MAG: patatin-like phospholipase family protein [Perlucidibaca sp.]
MRPGSFVLRAGPLAREQITREGLTPDSLAAFGAPAGGPKFLALTHLDSFLFRDWLPARRQPLPAFGSSIGAFRLVAAAHRDPAAAFSRLVRAYCAQRYDSKPDAAEVTRQVRHILHEMLDEADLEHVLAHPWLRLNLITTRCLGLAASRQPGTQALGFALAFLSNLRHRDRLASRFERCVFHNGTAAEAVLSADAFRTHHARLTRDNLAAVTLASGTIPLMMETVRDIPAGPAGAHIDGGMIDYHMDLALSRTPAGILFIPHYEQRVVPGWFDKGLKGRSARHTARMLVLSPAPARVAALPGGKIPCRKDFKRYHQRDDERLRAWDAGIALSQEIADEFRDLLASGRVADALQPL